MRKSDTSMLSMGGTGAGAAVVGSSARLHPARVTAAASAVQPELRPPGISRERSVLAGAFVADQQREIGCDGDTLGLSVVLGIELAAAEHSAGRIHLGVGALRPGQQEIGAGPRMTDHRRAVEPLGAGDPRELILGNDHS